MTSSSSLVRASAKPIGFDKPAPHAIRFVPHTKQKAYRTYALEAHIPLGNVESGLYWDTLDPYYYIRTQRASDGSESEILIAGDEDHKTGQDDDPIKHFRALEAWTRKRFQSIGEIEYHWSGQVLEPDDYLAFIGRNPGDQNVRLPALSSLLHRVSVIVLPE